MHFFTTSAQRERARYFDQFRTDAAAALTDPLVCQGLGMLSTELARANSRSILPNVRHGEVQVPRRYRNTDHIIVLPLLDHTSGRIIRAHDSLFQPTPQTQQYAREALTRQNSSAPNERAATRRIAAAIAALDPEVRKRSITAENPQTNSVHLNLGKLSIYSRPVITLPPGALKAHPVTRRVNAIHELVHGTDKLKKHVVDPEDAYLLPWLELRGYTAAAVVADAAVERGEVDSDFVGEEIEMTALIDSMRADCGLSREAVLKPDFVFPDELDDLAAEMFMYGAIWLD